MDDFRKGTSIPCCQLRAKVMGRRKKIPRLSHQVKLEGAKYPHDVFTIDLPAEGMHCAKIISYTSHDTVIASCILLSPTPFSLIFQILILNLQRHLETWLQQVYQINLQSIYNMALTMFSIAITKIIQVPLPEREVDWMHLNHLLLVHPQLIHLQPVAWI